MQLMAPVVVLPVLLPQLVQLLEPGALYLPAAHEAQGPLAPLLKVPAGHTIWRWPIRDRDQVQATRE